MKKYVLSLLLICVAACSSYAQWRPDVLSGYECRTVIHPDDYTGSVISTIIRKRPALPTKRGILYIHGFNDYFFQAQEGQRFVDSDYAFYAIDLRRYGRSLRNGDKRNQVRNMTEYFADIDSALVQMQNDSITDIILMGHSTGGLTAAYYQSLCLPDNVKALILNSPFLDWNLSPTLEHLVPIIAAIGRYFPDFPVPRGQSAIYSDSSINIPHQHHGYNTAWKSPISPDVDAGWIRAIDVAQKELRSGKHPIVIPILLMHSDKTISDNGDCTKPDMGGDSVLDVKEIAIYGRKLGPHVTDVTVNGALHDIALSRPCIANGFYNCIFRWLNKLGY